MKYDNIVEGIFIERVNRFIARVKINNNEVLVHVRNTGRCKELFIYGTRIFLEKSSNPNRKTAYSLVSIYKNDMLINIDSQIPNAVVFEGIMNGKIEELKDIITLKREVTYGSSRFDLYYETSTHKGFIEVKGVTLEHDGIAMFPDAPTERGRKHVLELVQASTAGYVNYLFFLIQMKGIHTFKPNYETDLLFAMALKSAQQSGVTVILFDSIIDRETISLGERFYY